MKRKTFVFVLSLALLVPLFRPVQAANPIRIWVDGNFVSSDVPLYVDKERTMVPLRLISENLGKKVEWKPEDPDIILISDPEPRGRSMTLCIGERLVLSSLPNQPEKHLMLDRAPAIKQNRTFVPLRNIAELFGKKVSWDQKNQVAVVGEGYTSQAEKMESSKDFLPYLYDKKMAGASLQDQLDFEKTMGQKPSEAFPGYTNKDVEVALAWLSYHQAGLFDDFRMTKNALDLLSGRFGNKLNYALTNPGTPLGVRVRDDDPGYPRRFTGLSNDNSMADLIFFDYYPNFDGTINTFRLPLHDHFNTREETLETYGKIFNNPDKVPLGDFSRQEVASILKHVKPSSDLTYDYLPYK